MTLADEKTYIIAAIVEHKPGVLYSVANLFRRRCFNIESICVGSSEQVDLARMTLTVKGDEKTVEQVEKQLRKLIDVVKVTRLDLGPMVTREMALIKVHTSETKTASSMMNYVDVFRGRIVDISPETIMVEITGGSDKINAFIELMKPFGIVEVARTGITALSRGLKYVKVDNGGR